MQKIVSFFVVSDGKQTCPYPSVLLHFLHSLIPYPGDRPPTALLGSFLRLTSPPPGACGGYGPLPHAQPSLQVPAGAWTCNPGREGPPPHTGSQWRLGSAPPLPPRPERVWAWAAGLEPLALLLDFGRRTIRRPAAWPWGSHGLAGAKGERARRAACCCGGMARSRGAWGSARADRARPLLLAVPAAQSGWVSPFGAPACNLHHLLYLRRPCLGSGSLPHALLSELPLVCWPILLSSLLLLLYPVCS